MSSTRVEAEAGALDWRATVEAPADSHRPQAITGIVSLIVVTGIVRAPF